MPVKGSESVQSSSCGFGMPQASQPLKRYWTSGSNPGPAGRTTLPTQLPASLPLLHRTRNQVPAFHGLESCLTAVCEINRTLVTGCIGWVFVGGWEIVGVKDFGPTSGGDCTSFLARSFLACSARKCARLCPCVFTILIRCFSFSTRTSASQTKQKWDGGNVARGTSASQSRSRDGDGVGAGVSLTAAKGIDGWALVGGTRVGADSIAFLSTASSADREAFFSSILRRSSAIAVTCALGIDGNSTIG